MNNKWAKRMLSIWIGILLLVPLQTINASSVDETKQLIYDEAGLLSSSQTETLNQRANEYSQRWDTDFIVYTSNNPAGTDVQVLMGDFYDDYELNSDVRNVSVVMLTLDMNNRELYVSGFYKGMEYVNNERADQIRDLITPSLSAGDYEQAFTKFLDKANEFMGIEPAPAYDPGSGSSGISSPGVPRTDYTPASDDDEESIISNGWFQLIVSLAVGGIAVGIMAANAGGRVTVNRFTYEDSRNSGVVSRKDQYIRTTVSKRKIERNTNSGGGGGGGRTGGGHSHSGSRGSF